MIGDFLCCLRALEAGDVSGLETEMTNLSPEASDTSGAHGSASQSSFAPGLGDDMSDVDLGTEP